MRRLALYFQYLCIVVIVYDFPLSWNKERGEGMTKTNGHTCVLCRRVSQCTLSIRRDEGEEKHLWMTTMASQDSRWVFMTRR